MGTIGGVSNKVSAFQRSVGSTLSLSLSFSQGDENRPPGRLVRPGICFREPGSCITPEVLVEAVDTGPRPIRQFSAEGLCVISWTTRSFLVLPFHTFKSFMDPIGNFCHGLRFCHRLCVFTFFGAFENGGRAKRKLVYFPEAHAVTGFEGLPLGRSSRSPSSAFFRGRGSCGAVVSPSKGPVEFGRLVGECRR